MKQINIAIDGPAGSGKGTTAKELAKRLNYSYLDTGAMYRAVAYYLHLKEISPKNFNEEDLKEISLSFNKQNHITLNEEDIEESIRTPEISELASTFSTIPQIRTFLVKKQQEIIKNKGFVAEGRDIGTKVMPEAELKIYLNASVEARAERRIQDYKKQGILLSMDETIQSIKERDHQDMTREIDPLVKTNDAIEVDTSDLTIEEQVDIIHEIAQKIIKYSKEKNLD